MCARQQPKKIRARPGIGGVSDKRDGYEIQMSFDNGKTFNKCGPKPLMKSIGLELAE